MLFAEVSPDAKKDLLNARKQSSEAKGYRRVKIIHLSSQHPPVPELAKLFDLCPATVRDYGTRYHAHGLAGLKRHAREGASRKMPLTKADGEDLLHQSPAQFDRLQTGARNWTQALVVEYLRADYDITVTQATVSRGLKQPKISWHRGALEVTSPDPLYTVKRERIDLLKKSGGGHVDQP